MAPRLMQGRRERTAWARGQPQVGLRAIREDMKANGRQDMSMSKDAATVVLFGGGGFVGRAVAQELFARGWRVRGW